MAAPKKNAKNGINDVKKVIMKSSDECGKCKNQCIMGKKYLERMDKPGFVGHGVACKIN